MKIKDMMLREVLVPEDPQRIISLVPSQTELLYDLGLGQRVVGRTKFCIHPKDQVKDVAIVGGTKKFDLDIIRNLKPDLILGNKEENYLEGIKALENEFPVWMSDISDLDDALIMVRSIGKLTNRESTANRLAGNIVSAFSKIEPVDDISCAYLIWPKPYMAVGSDTFIGDMLVHCGFDNVFKNLNRYPEVSDTSLQESAPDLLFLSSEPYPFREKHVASFKEFLPDTEILIVDGEMFSWYGSRLLESADYLTGLVNNLRHR